MTSGTGPEWLGRRRLATTWFPFRGASIRSAVGSSSWWAAYSACTAASVLAGCAPASSTHTNLEKWKLTAARR